MFCPYCESETNPTNGSCNICGMNLPKTSKPFNLLQELSATRHMPAKYAVIAGILVVVGAGGVFAYNKYAQKQQALAAALLQQQTQSQALAGQLNDLKQQTAIAEQQNTSQNQALSSQLDTQKAAAEKAQQQTQLAQQALALVQKQQSQQSQATLANGFPAIESRAIVLVVCIDGAGNAQSGSGTIVTSSGYVLTNKHVVTDSLGNNLHCAAFMNDGQSPSPKVISSVFYSLSITSPGAGFYANNYDAALLKIDGVINSQTDAHVSMPSSFPFIKPQGGGIKQGDQLFIFGYPAASNLVFNVTRGIVSSFSSDNSFINTDAVIDHGNSGGAAITSDGRFVGIPTSKYIAQGDYLGQILQVGNLNIPNK